MAINAVPEYFADLIMNVTFNNGVFRLTLGQVDANNRAVPVAKLFVPGNQMPAMINGLASANRRIATQLQERAKKAKAKKAKPAAKKTPKGKDKEKK